MRQIDWFRARCYDPSTVTPVRHELTRLDGAVLRFVPDDPDVPGAS